MILRLGITDRPRKERVRNGVAPDQPSARAASLHSRLRRITSASGALRTSMATCGYETLKEFQKAEVMVAPALQTEGKALQKAQRVGMGH